MFNDPQGLLKIFKPYSQFQAIPVIVIGPWLAGAGSRIYTQSAFFIYINERFMLSSIFFIAIVIAF
jgi:hypothetical protein